MMLAVMVMVLPASTVTLVSAGYTKLIVAVPVFAGYVAVGLQLFVGAGVSSSSPQEKMNRAIPSIKTGR
jgi:hypothetical protein